MYIKQLAQCLLICRHPIHVCCYCRRQAGKRIVVSTAWETSLYPHYDAFIFIGLPGCVGCRKSQSWQTFYYNLVTLKPEHIIFSSGNYLHISFFYFFSNIQLLKKWEFILNIVTTSELLEIKKARQSNVLWLIIDRQEWSFGSILFCFA